MTRFASVTVALLLLTGAARSSLVVNRVEITGLRLTREWVVTRHLGFAVGDTVSTDDLIAARKRLQNEMIFNDVRVEGDSSGVVRVRISEAWPLWPLLTLTFSEGQLSDVLSDPQEFADKVTVYAGAVHLNVGGSAGQIYAIMQAGAAQGYEAGYRTRWLAPHWPVYLGLNVQNLRVSDRHSTLSDSTRYLRDARYSILVATRQGARSRVGMELQYRGVRQESEYPAEGQRFRTVWFSPFVALDRRDSEGNPTRGAYAQVTTNLVTGNIRFVRSLYDARAYLPLSDVSRPPVLALRFTAATSNSATPSWAHFYHGFNTGLRGYLHTKSESATYRTGDVELRVPLTRESTYDVPLLGRWGRQLPWAIYGMAFAQRAELTLDGQWAQRTGFGGGFYLRVPYFHLLEVSASANRDGDVEYLVNTGISF